MSAAVTQLIDMRPMVSTRSLLIRMSWSFDTARASVLPRNIISMAKNDSNFGARVRNVSSLPTQRMMNGKMPKYVRMSKSGTTKRIGRSPAAKKFICGTLTQSGNTNAIPTYEMLISSVNPLAAAVIISRPIWNDVRNHASTRFSVRSEATERHWISLRFREASTPMPRNTTRPSRLTKKNIRNPPPERFFG